MSQPNSVGPLTPSAAETETRFRAVRIGDARRGIRLEQIYWNALKEIAAAEGIAIGDLIRATEESFPDARNITSLLRVMCLGWIQTRLSSVKQLASLSMIDSLVQASPAPAFALTEDKRIVVYNQTFLNFVQSRFSMVTAGSMAKHLRLSLDVQLGDLIQSLSANRNKPVGVGFVLGLDEQRFRGRINVVLAPATEQAIVISYVLPN
ncbi:MAG: ribbon-helix-helix domain-containing protein [Rhizobiaceae bacterium]|nr:ribbon-helix-helix domain-containing protein [Rhizobiaceae bacterium]MCV0405601.1 ribbon-helix-helix domain-containing protein [Rhizobiaceae bacterium]